MTLNSLTFVLLKSIYKNTEKNNKCEHPYKSQYIVGLKAKWFKYDHFRAEIDPFAS